jgi:putative ABC transport system substrate-binding protein
MRRREFISLIGSAAAAWPLAARAQQRAMPVIGLLGSTSPEGFDNVTAAFRKGLGETGYVEGRNVVMEFRWAQNQYDRLPALAAEFVRRQVAAIVAFGAINAPLAAKAATATIPIIFSIGSDPVEFGLVASLNRPGGNVTGVVQLSRELLAKRLELLRELLPNATSIGLIVNPNNPGTEFSVKEVQGLAHAGGWLLHVVPVAGEADLVSAFATLVRLKARAFLLGTDALFNSQYQQIVALAVRHSMPAIYQFREFAEAGGLMSYGTNRADQYHLVGTYAGRILKGEKPADLPVQLSTKVELVINLKTAKTLGLTFPIALLGRADEVIE